MFKRYITCGNGYQVLDNNNFAVRQASNNRVMTPDSDFLYLTVRAVSAGELHGANNNGDYFGFGELRKAWSSFVNRGVFVNHQSNDVEKCRGRICDASLIEQPDQCWVKLLLGVDERAFPQLARSIRKGYVRDVSMGATVRYSYCSVCNNEAHNEKQYCDHLKNYKGSRFANKKVYEDNRDVNFFEISFVVDGADPDAKIIELFDSVAPVTQFNHYQQVAQNNGMKHVASRGGSEVEVGRVVEAISKLRNHSYSDPMIRHAIRDKFPSITEREVELALLSTPNNFKQELVFKGRTIDTSLYNQIFNG